MNKKRIRVLPGGALSLPEFALRLHAALDRLGFPPMGKGRQTQLYEYLSARGVDISMQGVRSWLIGDAVPRRAKAAELAGALGISLAELELGSSAQLAEIVAKLERLSEEDLQTLQIMVEALERKAGL